jgi:hypothetical protein
MSAAGVRNEDMPALMNHKRCGQIDSPPHCAFDLPCVWPA